MSRSQWKIPFLDNFFYKKKLLSTKIIKIWSRQSVISELFIGKQVSIYNGQKFKKILITRDNVGYKFGDFCLTKKYSSKIKTSKKK